MTRLLFTLLLALSFSAVSQEIKLAGADKMNEFKTLLQNPSNKMAAGFGLQDDIKFSALKITTDGNKDYQLHYADINNDRENEFVLVSFDPKNKKRPRIQTVLKERRGILVDIRFDRLKENLDLGSPFFFNYRNGILINFSGERGNISYLWKERAMRPLSVLVPRG